MTGGRSRRAFLSAVSGTVVAGCTGEYENVVDEDVTLDVRPVELLPENEQLEEDWDYDEPDEYDGRAENTYTLPSSGDVGLSKFDAYVSVTIELFDAVEDAEREFGDDREISKQSLDTDSAKYGDEGYHGDGADDTHLRFRENNLYVDLTEMEGNSDAKSILKSFADAIMENLDGRTGE